MATINSSAPGTTTDGVNYTADFINGKWMLTSRWDDECTPTSGAPARAVEQWQRYELTPASNRSLAGSRTSFTTGGCQSNWKSDIRVERTGDDVIDNDRDPAQVRTYVPPSGGSYLDGVYTYYVKWSDGDVYDQSIRYEGICLRDATRCGSSRDRSEATGSWRNFTYANGKLGTVYSYQTFCDKSLKTDLTAFEETTTLTVRDPQPGPARSISGSITYSYGPPCAGTGSGTLTITRTGD